MAVFLYSATGHFIPPSVCGLLVDVLGGMFIFGIATAEATMIICVWAMWGRGRKMAIFLTTISLVDIVVAIMGLLQYRSSATYLLPSCRNAVVIIRGTHNVSFVNFAALTSLEVILFFLMLFKAVEYSRSHSSTFVVECFRHGLLYYVVLTIMSAINIMAILQSTQAPDIVFSIQRTFHAILSARMLLHLRRSASQTRGVNTNGTSLASDVMFQDGSNSTGDSVSDRGRLSVV
ncbi:hypothetical protein BD779DRAFT_106069 [Infundibulicybe gibba]|nr:hypothetical protein BD779DRAFT_106069 [Infundibulicybe gibba]